MYKLFFLLALVAFVAVFAIEDAEKDLSEAESAFAYYRPSWAGYRYYGRYAYPSTYYRNLAFPRFYNGLYL
ncbi:hypothetical protein DMENIID0001_124960 [Sergentomyia squamirostris]